MCTLRAASAASGPPSSASVRTSPIAASTTEGPESATEPDFTMTTKCAVEACSAESPYEGPSTAAARGIGGSSGRGFKNGFKSRGEPLKRQTIHSGNRPPPASTNKKKG